MKKFLLIIAVAITCFSIGYARNNTAGRRGRITCYRWENIDKTEAKHIESTAKKLLSLLAEVKIEQIWQQCDPIFQKDISHDGFLDFSYTLAEKITSLKALSLIDGKLVEIGREITKPHLISCGSNSVNSPDYFQLKIWPDFQKIAVVFFELKGGLISRRIVLAMGQRADGVYRLISLFINPLTFTGKNVILFENLAIKSGCQGDEISLFWFYRLAEMLSQTGPVIEFGKSLTLAKQLREMRDSPKFREKVTRIVVNGKSYPLYDLAFIELSDELLPIVVYLSRFNGMNRDAKTADRIEAEATTLYKSLRQAHPEIFREFPAVMFQAYFEPPVDPKKKYPFFKVRIDPSKITN